jgi:hypothetical protein
MAENEPLWKQVRLTGETLHFPSEIRRALGPEGPLLLYFFLEDQRVVIVSEADFVAYLADYLTRHKS